LSFACDTVDCQICFRSHNFDIIINCIHCPEALHFFVPNLRGGIIWIRLNGASKPFRIDADNRVFDNGGSQLGNIDAAGNIYKAGSLVGSIGKDETVRINGAIKGIVDAKGNVSVDGTQVGQAAGLRREATAAIYFPFFFNAVQ
jgi:hypothetical protein